jgi:hypothetical protein
MASFLNLFDEQGGFTDKQMIRFDGLFSGRPGSCS